jgi:hypothetical protein
MRETERGKERRKDRERGKERERGTDIYIKREREIGTKREDQRKK